MATNNGKKNKKKKEVKLTWQQFMGNNEKTVTSWAEEVDKQNPEDEFHQSWQVNQLNLPKAPRAARGPDVDDARIPTHPPFQAYIGNLPFEVNEEDIRKFFKNLKVVNIKLQTDSVGRIRGFGYVEFESRQMLIESLAFNDLNIKNRAIKVDLATQNQEREKRDDFHRKDDGEDRTLGDWRKRDAGNISERSFRRDDRGSDFDNRQSGSQRNFGNRGNYGDRRDNDGYADRNRGFGGRQQGGFNRDGYQNRDRFQRDERSDGFGSYEGSSDRRSPAREENWRRGPASNTSENHRGPSKDWKREGSRERDSSKQDAWRSSNVGRDYADSQRKPKESDVPAAKERPKLNLMPRSKASDESQQGAASSSIFGWARPVDTSQREREIEEKLKKMQVTKTFEEEKRHSQSSDDYAPRKKSDGSRRQDDVQPVRKEKPQPANQRVKRDSEESNEATQSAPVRVVPAPPPMVNVWEARRHNQQQQKQVVMPAQREEKACRSSQVQRRQCESLSEEASPEPEDPFESEKVIKEDIVEVVTKTTQTSNTMEMLSDAQKANTNIWEARAKERDTKEKDTKQQTVEKETDKTIRRTAVSVGDAMKNKNAGPGQRGYAKRAEGETVTAIVSVKQKERTAAPLSCEDASKAGDRSRKDWSGKNKYSALEDDHDDDELDDDDDIDSHHHSNDSKRMQECS